MTEETSNQSKNTKPTQVSKLFRGDDLYEQIYDPTSDISRFLGWDSKERKWYTVDSITMGGVKYVPITNKALPKKVVLLPSGVEEYEGIEALDKSIWEYSYKYSDVSDEFRKKATWYVRLTWVMDYINTIPYLRLLGDWGAGKSRFNQVIGGICYKRIVTGGAITSAPIFRLIDTWQGTLVLDEFSLRKGGEDEALTKILNCGYQRELPVIRCASADYDKLSYFDTFGPKIISSRKSFDDRALESRCITELMIETNRKDIPIELLSSFYKERDHLRNQLLLYRFKTWNQINPNKSLDIDFGDIPPRVKQSFLPFTYLIHDEESLEAFKGEVKRYNTILIEGNSISFDGHVIHAYLDCIRRKPEFITAEMIRDELVKDYGYYEDRTHPATIGKHMNALGFRSGMHYSKVDGKTYRVKTIEDKGLKNLVSRYVTEVNREIAFSIIDGTIEPSDIDKVFEMFSKGTNGKTPTNGSNGV